MNSNVKKLADHFGKLWAKWLRATGVDHGCGYRVPEGVWDAAWNGNWPNDEEAIRWILEEYLDVETAKANGYLELVIPLREQAEAALDDANNSFEQQRQIRIDADIDEVIKTIKGLGLKPDEKTTAIDSCSENPSPKRNRWIRKAIMAITIFAIGTFAGFVGAYTFDTLNGAGEIRVSRLPEIRRAIPVEPEIRRAIPVEPEIRKAIPVADEEIESNTAKSKFVIR
jgi:nitrate reductase NapE component